MKATKETQKWMFTTDDNSYHFIIEVEIGKNPYNVAYDHYGPQVNDMMYFKYFENESTN